MEIMLPGIRMITFSPLLPSGRSASTRQVNSMRCDPATHSSSGSSRGSRDQENHNDVIGNREIE